MTNLFDDMAPVPKVATEEMFAAGFAAVDGRSYPAMLSARPTQALEAAVGAVIEALTYAPLCPPSLPPHLGGEIMTRPITASAIARPRLKGEFEI